MQFELPNILLSKQWVVTKVEGYGNTVSATNSAIGNLRGSKFEFYEPNVLYLSIVDSSIKKQQHVSDMEHKVCIRGVYSVIWVYFDSDVLNSSTDNFGPLFTFTTDVISAALRACGTDFRFRSFFSAREQVLNKNHKINTCAVLEPKNIANGSTVIPISFTNSIFMSIFISQALEGKLHPMLKNCKLYYNYKNDFVPINDNSSETVLDILSASLHINRKFTHVTKLQFKKLQSRFLWKRLDIDHLSNYSNLRGQPFDKIQNSSDSNHQYRRSLLERSGDSILYDEGSNSHIPLEERPIDIIYSEISSDSMTFEDKVQIHYVDFEHVEFETIANLGNIMTKNAVTKKAEDKLNKPSTSKISKTKRKQQIKSIVANMEDSRDQPVVKQDAFQHLMSKARDAASNKPATRSVFESNFFKGK